MIKAILLLAPVYISLFWSIILFLSKKSQNNAKQILGVFMFFSFFLYICHAIYFYEEYYIYSFTESLYLFIRLSLYPIFYCYILALSTVEYNKKRYLLHFIPGILFGLLTLLLTILSSPQERIIYVETMLVKQHNPIFDFSNIIEIRAFSFFLSRIIFIAQSICYLIMGIKLANKHNILINNYFSNTEDRKLLWVKIIGIIGLFLSSGVVLFTFIGKSFFLKNEAFLIVPSFFFTTVFFIIGYHGHKQKDINFKLDISETEDSTSENQEIKTTIDKELKTKLINLFEKENIFNQQDLRITSVAEKLNTNRTYISRLINDEFNMNFNEFVNKYRIQDAKKLILSNTNKKHTIDYIAEKSGFGSTASFLRVFKEIEGTTPSKFRNNHKEQTL
jgi:AraC-like DNA-binding protein